MTTLDIARIEVTNPANFLINSDSSLMAYTTADENKREFIKDFILADLNRDYKYVYKWITNDPNWQVTVPISAQTLNYNLTPANPSSPAILDLQTLSGEENGLILLKNISGLSALAFPSGTHFDLTVTKNGQSFTINDIVLMYDSPEQNGFAYISNGEMNYSNVDYVQALIEPVDAQVQSDLNTFLTNQSVAKQYGAIIDSDVSVTFTIPQQNAIGPGEAEVISSNTVKLGTPNPYPDSNNLGFYWSEVIGSPEALTELGQMDQNALNDSFTILLPSDAGFIVVSQNNGGGGSSTPSVTGTVLVGGKAVGTVSVDPRTTAVKVTINGVEQALPLGSVVRNTVTGQKFLKSEGGELAFVAIELTPKAEWSWSTSADDAWEVLQGL